LTNITSTDIFIFRANGTPSESRFYIIWNQISIISISVSCFVLIIIYIYKELASYRTRSYINDEFLDMYDCWFLFVCLRFDSASLISDRVRFRDLSLPFIDILFDFSRQYLFPYIYIMPTSYPISISLFDSFRFYFVDIFFIFYMFGFSTSSCQHFI